MVFPGLETIADGPSAVPPEYVVIIALETITSLVILAVALALFVRGRRNSSLFVTAALSALLIRYILGLLTVLGLLTIDSHQRRAQTINQVKSTQSLVNTGQAPAVQIDTVSDVGISYRYIL